MHGGKVEVAGLTGALCRRLIIYIVGQDVIGIIVRLAIIGLVILTVGAILQHFHFCAGQDGLRGIGDLFGIILIFVCMAEQPVELVHDLVVVFLVAGVAEGVIDVCLERYIGLVVVYFGNVKLGDIEYVFCIVFEVLFEVYQFRADLLLINGFYGRGLDFQVVQVLIPWLSFRFLGFARCTERTTDF